MKQWVERGFGEQGDREAVLGLVACRPPERVADYPGMLDLEELLASEETQQGTVLWFDAQNRLAGFALLDGDMLSFEIAPDVPQEELAGAVLKWAVERLRRPAESNAEAGELFTSCRAENPARAALLEQMGFAAEPVRTLHFRRDLRVPIPSAALPEGFVIRPVQGEEEVERHVGLHRAAFGTEEMTMEMRLAMMRTPEYDRTLDLVAVAPDGALAAYVMCHIQPRENALRGIQVGYTDPVATRPAYQRMGLARALLLSGLQLLKERGMVSAELGTYGENTGMIQTALSAGFEVCGSTIFFTREINDV